MRLLPLFAYQYAGLDAMGDPQIRLADKSITKTPNVSKPGDIRYHGHSTNPYGAAASAIHSGIRIFHFPPMLFTISDMC